MAKHRFTVTFCVREDYEGSVDPSQLLEAAQDTAWELQANIDNLGIDATVEDRDGEGDGDGPCVEEVKG